MVHQFHFPANESRRENIADLARVMLPMVEQSGARDRFRDLCLLLLMMALSAFFAWSAAQYLRPLSYAEERNLRVLLEYTAQQKAISTEEATRQLLDYFYAKRLSDLRASQWNEAIRLLVAE